MNKKVLIDKITERVDMTKKDVAYFIDVCFDEIIEALKKEKNVNLVGFGSFEVRHRAAREGRSPIDHSKITIPSSNYVGFKSGSALKKAIRGK
ncbi:MAG: HU family DNA-binding protein [Candidatus Margulisbacteria bacterium]|nr:HU family DNA-binding protein [Candidatus Margulisiibacteriota bacterium]